MRLIIGLMIWVLAVAAGAAEVTVIVDRGMGEVASHGVAELYRSLHAKNVIFDSAEMFKTLENASSKQVIVAGLAGGDGEAARLLKETKTALPEGPEALVIKKLERDGRTVWVLCGSDKVGLMYALLDAADRIGWAKDPGAPLSELREADERPDVRDRAISIYTMQRAAFEQRFYDERYWNRYFDMMARDRYNSFVLIFGYENGGFLAPPYPYFFDVGGFPDVKMVGLTPEQQNQNLAALNRLISQAHSRGIRVTLGIWDHIYRAGVQTGGVKDAWAKGDKPTPGLVWGVTAENLNDYTCAALERLLQEVPEVDGLQFRMHGESGLKKGEMGGFWHRVFALIKARRPDLRFDARVKELPDSVIEDALAQGIKLRLNTKYWMEQMGLPFHPTHINTQNQHDRRHGYADLLTYPQRAKMVWQLWAGGTARVLLWGDPEYARRFAASTHLYDGDGFEVNEPLATKMEAQPHDARPFELLAPEYRSYDYEFERYWHFFQVFGRLGYNPQTPEEVWMKEFERRFGQEAAPCVAQGLHQASGVLPRIVASVYPYGGFPTTRGWAERQRLGDLPNYAKNQGSDIELFENFADAAKRIAGGGETAKVRPDQNAAWFTKTASAISAFVDGAEKKIGARRGPEFNATIIDLKILAGLARFHGARIPAAVSYNQWKLTKNPNVLEQAITGERVAIEAWRGMVAAAGQAYAPDLMMGVRSADLCGHWRDELQKLEDGLAALEQERKAQPADGRGKSDGSDRTDRPEAAQGQDREGPRVRIAQVDSAPAGKPITISAEVSDPAGVKWVRLRWRPVTQFEDYRTLEMKPAGDGKYEATVPAGEIDPKYDFMVFIEAMDAKGNGVHAPNFEKEAPYVVMKLER